MRWVLLALVLLLALGAAERGYALHPHHNPDGLRVLWRDLEVGGDGTMTYRFCDSPIQPEWTAGIDAWDEALDPTMEFSEVPCSSAADTLVAWEGAYGSCDDMPSGAILYACWRYDFCNIHGSHCDLPHGATRILFDRINYGAPDDGGQYELQNSFAWRKFGMLHEWSENVGLQSHTEAGYDCNGSPAAPGQPTVTDGMVNPDGALCPQNPPGGDVTSVKCNVYTLCAGVRVAVGDIFTGDGGCEEIVTAPGPGPDSWVRVWDAAFGNCITQTSGVFVRAQFRAYASGFQGGVYVAAGNFDGTTFGDEVVTGAGAGAGSHVVVWRINSNGTATALYGGGFFANPGSTTGVRVGAGDMDCDNFDEEILTAPGGGAQTQVKTFQSNGAFWSGFEPYPGFTGGAYVAGGNLLNSDCGGEIATGPDQGGGDNAKTFTDADGVPVIGSWCAYAPPNCAYTGGVRVGVANVQEGTVDADHEVITGQPNTHVKAWNTNGSGVTGGDFIAYPGFQGGVYVAGGNVNGGTASEVVTGAGEGGGPHVRVMACCNPLSEVTWFFAY